MNYLKCSFCGFVLPNDQNLYDEISDVYCPNDNFIMSLKNQ